MWDRPQLKRSQLEPELQKLYDGTYQLMMGRDLSREPELIGHMLRVCGLMVYKLSHCWFSELLSTVEFDAVIYNVIELDNVRVPDGYIKVRLRDLQEFPYTAGIRVHMGG